MFYFFVISSVVRHVRLTLFIKLLTYLLTYLLKSLQATDNVSEGSRLSAGLLFETSALRTRVTVGPADVTSLTKQREVN